jgi:hypothetical protein
METSRRIREVHERSQEEVARLLAISQAQVARAEQSALRKLRANPEAKLLMRYVSQHHTGGTSPYVEPALMRKFGAGCEDASFLTISGFAPNL